MTSIETNEWGDRIIHLHLDNGLGGGGKLRIETDGRISMTGVSSVLTADEADRVAVALILAAAEAREIEGDPK